MVNGRISIGNAVQCGENLRNSLSLDYESPALTAELQARFQRVSYLNAKVALATTWLLIQFHLDQP